MRVSINVDFTDEELRKYAVDVGRRVGLNFVHDIVKHVGVLKEIPPGVISNFASGIVSALSKDPGPKAGDRVSLEDLPPGARVVGVPDKCARVAATPDIEEGWFCHCCVFFNVLERSTCRNCEHKRCDIIVPPPPGPSREDLT